MELKILLRNIPGRLSKVNHNPGRVLQAKWIRVPIMVKKTYKGAGRLAGRKALITGGDSGIGRAAVIAYAREGADVAINSYPSEEPDVGSDCSH